MATNWTKNVKLTVKEASIQCRSNAHGCLLYTTAFSDLKNHYRSYHPNNLNPSLEVLWGWVDGYLQMQEASNGPTPLG